AGDELARGSLDAAERYLALAEGAPTPPDRQGQAQLLAGIIRLLAARQRGNLAAVTDEAQRLQAMAGGPDAAQPALGGEVRALALISLGYAPNRTAPLDPAEHPGQGDRAGPPDPAAVSRVHRPGQPGGERIRDVVRADGRALQAGDRGGRTARLGRRPARRDRVRVAWSRAGLAGAAGGGRTLDAA